MNWFIIIIVALLWVPTFLMMSLLCKRLLLLCRLKSMCKSRGFQLIPTHSFWWMGWTQGENCDFHVITRDTVYSVKLIGTVSKRILYDFVDESNYSTQNLMFQFSAAASKIPYEEKKKKPYQFSYKLPNEHMTKSIVPVILMNPISLIVSVSTFESKRKPIENGEYVNEGYFFSASAFLRELRKTDAQ